MKYLKLLLFIIVLYSNTYAQTNIYRKSVDDKDITYMKYKVLNILSYNQTSVSIDQLYFCNLNNHKSYVIGAANGSLYYFTFEKLKDVWELMSYKKLIADISFDENMNVEQSFASFEALYPFKDSFVLAFRENEAAVGSRYIITYLYMLDNNTLQYVGELVITETNRCTMGEGINYSTLIGYSMASGKYNYPDVICTFIEKITMSEGCLPNQTPDKYVKTYTERYILNKKGERFTLKENNDY